MSTGENLNRYFFANACYQSGLIYEKKGEQEKAIQYYNKCLNAPDHEYKKRLDQKAKAAINRLQGKSK